MANYELPLIIGLIGTQGLLLFLASVLKHKDGDSYITGNFVTAIKLGFFLFVIWTGLYTISITQLIAQNNSAPADIITSIEWFYTVYVYFAILITSVIIVYFFYAVMTAIRVKRESENEQPTD